MSRSSETPSRAVLGIDPGVNGGMALLRIDGTITAVWVFQPKDPEVAIVAAVREAVALLEIEGGRDCFMERVGYMPTDGGKGAFTFGLINGLLRGALLASGFQPQYVYPQLWQATMECLSGGNKNVTKTRAKQLFPGQKITHANADALLIAEFGRRRLLRGPVQSHLPASE